MLQGPARIINYARPFELSLAIPLKHQIPETRALVNEKEKRLAEAIDKEVRRVLQYCVLG